MAVGRPCIYEYEPQRAFGVVTPEALAKWLGEETTLVSKFLPSKDALVSISLKFALAEANRKHGRLP